MHLQGLVQRRCVVTPVRRAEKTAIDKQIDLRGFVAEADELSRRRLLASGRGRKFIFSNFGDKFEDHSEREDPEDLRSYLLGFRLFWAKREPYYLPRIYAAARAVVAADPSLTDRLLGSEKRLENIDARTPFFDYKSQDADGNVDSWTVRKLADWWMHGQYFHRSNAMKTTWWYRHPPMDRAWLEMVTLLYVYAYSDEVFEVARVLRAAGFAEP